jgi:hypothetical protein
VARYRLGLCQESTTPSIRGRASQDREPTEHAECKPRCGTAECLPGCPRPAPARAVQRRPNVPRRRRPEQHTTAHSQRVPTHRDQ